MRLACVGDSNTEGVVGASYVRLLTRRLRPRGIEVLNFGTGGDLAENVLRRLDKVISARPDVVTVMIGTNDVAARISDLWRDGYLRDQRPERPPTEESYRATIAEIVDRLRRETSAHLALLEIPPLGEYLRSRENGRVVRYNAVLHDIAESTGIACLPVFTWLAEALHGHQSTPWDGTKQLMDAAARRRRWHLPWNAISRLHGLRLTTDAVHLNDRGARLVAAAIDDYVASISAPA